MRSCLLHLILLLLSHPALAMDYSDSAQVRESPSLDLGNFYAWYDSSKPQVYLIATLGPTLSTDPQLVFERKGKYRLHVDIDNDLKEDLTFDFYFGGNQEFAVTTGPETLRGPIGTHQRSDNWQVFAAVTLDPAFGDFAALTQFFTANFPCSPTAALGLRCGDQAATGQPANALLGQNTGYLAVGFDPVKFGVSATGKINVWASSWAVP